MPAIQSQFSRVIQSAGGAESIEVTPTLSHHALVIEGAGTGPVTVEVRHRGLTGFRAFDDNVIAENGVAVISVGAIEAVRLTPATAGVAYAVSVSSF